MSIAQDIIDETCSDGVIVQYALFILLVSELQTDIDQDWVDELTTYQFEDGSSIIQNEMHVI